MFIRWVCLSSALILTADCSCPLTNIPSADSYYLNALTHQNVNAMNQFYEQSMSLPQPKPVTNQIEAQYQQPVTPQEPVPQTAPAQQLTQSIYQPITCDATATASQPVVETPPTFNYQEALADPTLLANYILKMKQEQKLKYPKVEYVSVKSHQKHLAEQLAKKLTQLAFSEQNQQRFYEQLIKAALPEQPEIEQQTRPQRYISFIQPVAPKRYY